MLNFEVKNAFGQKMGGVAGGGVRVIVFWRSKKKMANYRGKAFKGWKGKNYALSLLASFAKKSLFVFVFKHLI